MLKKLFVAMLAAAGFAAVTNAAEQIQLQLNVLQDKDVAFEVIEVSDNVKANARPHTFSKFPGRGQGFVVKLEDGKAEITIKVKLNGKGPYFLSGCGFGARRKQIPIRCTKLVIDDKTYFPDANGKPFDFDTWRKLSGKDNLVLDGEKEHTITASFVRGKAAKKPAAKKKTQD